MLNFYHKRRIKILRRNDGLGFRNEVLVISFKLRTISSGVIFIMPGYSYALLLENCFTLTVDGGRGMDET